MISFPTFAFPYSVGVNETIKFVPSFPYGSSIPVLGNTMNSGAESAVKKALNSAYCHK